MANLKELAEDIVKKAPRAKGSDIVEKGLDALSLPQKLAFKKIAETAGVTPGKSSEESAFNLVDKVASKLGIPEDSIVGNVAKAAAVAGAEVFGDPLGPIAGGIGKLGKLGSKAAKLGIVDEASKRLRKLKPLENITKTAAGNPAAAPNIKTFAKEAMLAPQQKIPVIRPDLTAQQIASSSAVQPPVHKIVSGETQKKNVAEGIARIRALRNR